MNDKIVLVIDPYNSLYRVVRIDEWDNHNELASSHDMQQALTMAAQLLGRPLAIGLV